jgi:hypothetical protein
LSDTTTPSPLAYVPISTGELVDKITILEIKAQRVSDPSKRNTVCKELQLLTAIYAEGARDVVIEALKRELHQINETLWDVEDCLRACERKQTFGEEFISLARAVYKTNDRRAELKRRINEISGSALWEIKSHAPY